MRTLKLMSSVLAICFSIVVVVPLVAQEPAPPEQELQRVFPKKPPYSPYADRHYPERVYWGDTHLHTSFSMDAGAFGCRLTPRDAYRFAKGQEVTASSGQPARLARPLDFLVVADHSDGFGFFPLLFKGDPAIMADPQGRRWNEMILSGQGAAAAIDIITSFGKGAISKAIFPVPGTAAYQTAWEETIKAAEEANDPGRFTAFIGYEWTSNTGGNNLHRNIIFRDDASKASLVEPYTTQKPLGSDNPRDLWKWMSGYEEKTGGHVLAIAHNGNLSNGRMFPLIESFTGKPIDREYAETRAMRERIYEVTQIKGDGETHPFLSPNDEFANYERWDKGNLDLTEKKKPEMLEFEYARAALRNGLKLEQELGVNPYKFGMIGSTDAHTGLAAIDEDNFWGKTSNVEPSATARPIPGLRRKMAPSWGGNRLLPATRASGPLKTRGKLSLTRCNARRFTRQPVREWSCVSSAAGTLKPATPTRAILRSSATPREFRWAAISQMRLPEKSPTFLVAALKDPIGANLDRIQIIKGWLDAKAKLTKKSTTLRGLETASLTPKPANSRRSVTPWMFQTQPTPTPSARRN